MTIERHLHIIQVWIFDGKENIAINKPSDLWQLIAVATHPAMQYGANILSVPTTRGCEWGVKDASVYITADGTTEEERRQRKPVFREKTTPWIEDFETEWRAKAVPEMMEHAEQLKTVDLACFSEKRSYKRDLEFGRTSS